MLLVAFGEITQWVSSAMSLSAASAWENSIGIFSSIECLDILSLLLNVGNTENAPKPVENKVVGYRALECMNSRKNIRAKHW
jgi:hypothetical protein